MAGPFDDEIWGRKEYLFKEGIHPFGEMTAAQIGQKERGEVIPIPNYRSDDCPEEVRKLLGSFHDMSRTWKKPVYDVKDERIVFGWQEQLYEIRGKTLGVAGSTFEAHTAEILRALSELGSNYGNYEGHV